MNHTITGLERLIEDKDLQNKIKGNVALLCHSASIDSKFRSGIIELKKIFGKRLVKVFGPQHGFVTDVQDNMIESKHYVHPYFQIPIYSLYSETRIPTDEMLEGIDTFIVDVQDVGTRVYTYISTLSLLMEKLAQKKLPIKIVVLDRPNPVGGNMIEGPILKDHLRSFVGRYPIPQRHSLTMGEIALFGTRILKTDCDMEVIPMLNWRRNFFWKDTLLPWVLPSPNLPTPEGALTFAGTVLFEGTNLSEGRGTTRPLEIIGHPSIEPFSFCEDVLSHMKSEDLLNENELHFNLRPVTFLPTFQKHSGKPCGGIHIHPLNFPAFASWRVSQVLCREFKRALKDEFQFHQNPYEYEYNKRAIDLINGDEAVAHWVDKLGTLTELIQIESQGHETFKEQKANISLYL